MPVPGSGKSGNHTTKILYISAVPDQFCFPVGQRQTETIHNLNLSKVSVEMSFVRRTLTQNQFLEIKRWRKHNFPLYTLQVIEYSEKVTGETSVLSWKIILSGGCRVSQRRGRPQPNILAIFLDNCTKVKKKIALLWASLVPLGSATDPS